MQIPIALIPIVPIVFTTSCAMNEQKVDQDDEKDEVIIPEDKPDQNDLWLSAGSDNLNGLKIDRYANVIKQLQLSASDQISQYTNQKLTNHLWDGTNLTTDYKIEIVSGDSSKGNLSLKLIRPNLSDEIINISNFHTQAPVYHQYQNFDLNLDKWFMKLLPINVSANFASAIEAIDSGTWNQLIADGYVNIIDKTTLNHLKTVQLSQLKAAGYQFQFKARISKNDVLLNVETFMYGYQYNQQEQKWVVNQDSFDLVSQSGKLIIHLPTIRDVKQYLMRQTKFDPEVAKQILPSAIVGQINAWTKHEFGNYFNDQLIINPLLDEQSQFLKTYFKNQRLTLNFADYQYQSNDDTGALDVVIELMIDGDHDGISQILKLQMQTNTQLKAQLSQISDQWIIQNDSWKKNILTNLKRDHDLAKKVDQYLQTGGTWQDVNISDGINLIPDLLMRQIFSANESRQKHWTLLQRQFGTSLTLFGKIWNADFDSARPLAKPNEGQYLYYNNLINVGGWVIGLDYLTIDWSNLKTTIVANQNNQLVLKFSGLKLNLIPFGSGDGLNSDLTINVVISANDWNS